MNRLGFETRGDSVDEIAALLQRSGVALLSWFGVRLFTDGWVETQPKASEIDDLFAVELEASRRDPYRHLSRLFHLVGQKASNGRA